MRQAVPLSFSPDGTRLLVGSNLESTQQLYALPARGGALERLTHFAEPVSGAFLPDGPMTATSSPGCTSMETPRSASTAVSPSP